MSNPRDSETHICKRIDASVYGRLEKAQGPERLKIARSLDLYQQIATTGYSPERIKAMLLIANRTRHGNGPGFRYS
jgi:hypothetical protein